ncbi:MAG TPA: lipocalin-like domain-containing protein [Candidatus Acidoferrales bacterium]|nr:lipocalin-like domain-containing protein [Candidatus Acidoferrales bacterium]
MASNPLVGVWKLLSYEARDLDDGTTTALYGDRPSGYITYGSTGYMSVVFMAGDRSPIEGGDVQGGPTEQRLQAMDTFNAYSGTYDYDGQSVRHHVEVAMFPNWVGSTQLRQVDLTENRLTLSSPPMVRRGKNCTAHLTWERVSG